MIKIKNILKRCAALACAAAIGVTTLATSASAAVSGVTIKYEWNSSVNPTLYTRKNAVSGGVSGQYLRYGEQICRFSPSSSNGYAFCIEPAKQMLGYQYGNWYTQYGFTKYDTFNLTDKNTADTTAYWKSLGGTSGYYSKYMGLVEYYGYGSHKTGDYYAATQILIWEMILGYRGHTPSTFSKCSDVLWNDFTYPANCYCTKAGVEKAYNEIVASVNGHYNMPSGVMKPTPSEAINHPAILLKYDTNKMRYQGSCTVPNVYLNANSLTHNFSTTEAKLVEMAKARFTGTYGKDYGVEKTTNGTNTVFTLWSTNRPFTSSSASTIYTTAPIQMQIKSGISQFETLFANSYYQTCLLSTKLDPVSGYIGMASYNEPNMIVEKTYTDSHNRALTAQTLSSMLDKTSFVISTNINGKTYYVQAAKTSDGTAYSFTKYVGSAADATKFVTLKKSNTNGLFTVYDLPTSASSGRTYTVTEYTVPDNERYEKLSKSVTLPSPTSGALTQDPGTKTVKMNNTERGYNAQFGDAELDKSILNGDGKALSSDKESDISKLSNIYKSTKFIVGYWDGNTVRYLSNAYMSAKNAFDGDLKDLDNFNDVTYKAGDGMYYVPTKLNSDHKLVFDNSRTTADMSKAFVFCAGSNYSGTETCAHFGEIYLNLLPLNADKTVKEVFFIEVNGTKGYGYSSSLDTSKAVSLKTIGSVSDKRNLYGLVKNDTGSSITVSDDAGKYVIANGRYYPISSNKLEGNKLHSDANIVNQLTTYGLRLVKKNGNGEVIPGAKYGLYNANKALLKTGTTNANGEIKFEYDLVPNTDYYVHEISAPQGYVLDTQYYKVNKANTVVNDTDTFSNAKLPEEKITTIEKEFELRIELDKYDVINDVKVEGIEFDVSLNGKSVGTMKTDKNGHAVIEHLPLGKLNGYRFENVYELTEKKNSSYILLDDEGNAVRKIRIETTVADIKDETNPVITYTCDVPNTLQTVDLTVHKVDEFHNTIKGAKFEIYPTKDVVFNGKTVQTAGKVLGTLETDKDGKASTSYMEYAQDGTHGYEMKIPVYPGHEYALREIYVPEPYVIPKNNVTKFTAKAGETNSLTVPHSVVVPNEHQHGKLFVYKTDNETKKPLAGAEFEVRAAEDLFFGKHKVHSKGDVICHMVSDNNGKASSKDAVMYVGGKYTLTETKAVPGYVLNKESKTFEFSFKGNEAEYSSLTIDFDNTTQKGVISVYKTGDVFTTVTGMASAIAMDEKGNIYEDGYSIFTPQFARKNIAGAEFEIKAAEDIVTKDGTLRYSKGDVVDKIKTNSKGEARTKELYLGKYTVTEVKAPTGYVISSKPKTVEIEYAGQDVAVNTAPSAKFSNDYQQVKISITKAMERDSKFNVGSSKDVKYVQFGLFAAEKITAADGSYIPKDGLIAVANVGENMTAVFDQKIPFGKYYVQEIATDEKYIINGEKHLVTFEYAGQNIPTVEIDCGKMKNKLKRGTVEGIKVDEHDKPLENAVFGLFKADCKEFMEANAIMTAVSDKDGKFGFEKIPYGKYIVTELVSPDGYVFSDKQYEVTISKDKQIIKLKAVNEEITLNISKKDVYGKELKGAKMQLIDKDGKVVDEWTSDGSVHVVKCLKAGKYILKEIAAPSGYIIATDIEFEIDKYNKVTVKDVKALATDDKGVPTIVMVDDTTKVKISKQDMTSGKELPGAKLQVLDENGTIVEEWTSSDKPHYIEAKLTAGKKYTLREVLAPNGYDKATDITFTVNDKGEVTQVVMKDKLKPTTPPDTPPDNPPQTGYVGNSLPIGILLGAVVMCVVAMIFARKKDDKNEKAD